MQLDLLLAGLSAIGVGRDDAWRVAVKAALDSIPAIRRDVMNALVDADAETPDLAEQIGYPKGTTLRALEDLEGHGVVDRIERGKGSKPARWALAEWVRKSYAVSVPETSDKLFTSPTRVFDDISGTQTLGAAR